jgi:transposase
MEQKKILDKFIDTSRFVYNRTLEFIKKGHKPNFQDLRDLLVTENTKKGLVEYKEYDQIISDLREKQKTEENKAEIKRIVEKIKQVQQERRNKMKEYDYIKNPLVNSFETGTPKDIRSNAVKRCCDAMKSGFSNLKNGNIKFFNMKFKKKTEPIQTIELTPKIISIHNGNIKIAPETFLGNCYLKIDKHNNRKLKHLEIVNNVDITRFKRRYYLQLSIKTNPISCDKCDNIAGVDPGVRTFATVHSNNISSNEIEITEYKHRSDVLKKLNNKIKSMNKLRRRIRKKQYNKIEKRPC